ncbi:MULTISPECIES: MFS transporter [Legionella]|uniref:MFS transporter n=1 Tax=Legionella resiliens TaxID=2905958 RepID=A0ABS8WWQ2_9GAMM|nr:MULTISPECIES: MFS transporter [unclassified Legionella]MCE0721744.1 MFS transporter [Legionella sp. 9fVS26]MCE3530898.1 MFS transporter [Legionella sp. 8cVS16]QLZ70461.1 MFS transporter [Legionella sp. PC1000]
MDATKRKSIFAGLYGNTLEWFDFLLYANFTPLFAQLFFPSDEYFVSLLLTFGVFSVGFFMRPLGGVLLGHYADQIGRRKTLILSISIMTFSTACIALIPDFNSIGIVSPLLFIFFRLIQGVAVGGELPGSTTFLIEHMADHRRGFAGSLVLSTAFLGIFLGSFTASLLSVLLTEDTLRAWGWRLAYLIGALLGLIGIYLRLTSVEPATFLKAKHTTELPAKIVFFGYSRKLVLAIIFTSILAMSNYLLIAYITSFLVKSEGFLLRDALVANFIALLVLTILIPLMGLLSDYFGRKPIFLLGALGIFICIYPIFILFSSGIWWQILLGEIVLAIILAPLNAAVPTMLAEMFPTAIRASGVSIGYNIGQAVFGGTMPLVSLTLVELTGNKYAPAFYILFWVIIAIIAARSTRETYLDKLD